MDDKIRRAEELLEERVPESGPQSLEEVFRLD